MRDRACSSFPVGPLDAMLAGSVFTEGFFRGQWEVDPGSTGRLSQGQLPTAGHSLALTILQADLVAM